MSKITNDGLTRLAQDANWLYPYGNSGRQRINDDNNNNEIESAASTCMSGTTV